VGGPSREGEISWGETGSLVGELEMVMVMGDFECLWAGLPNVSELHPRETRRGAAQANSP